MLKLVSWDIETHKVLPEDVTNIMDHRPLGITCISLLCTGQEKPTLFYSGAPGEPLPRKMNAVELTEFVDELWGACTSGYRPLAWNGNFDFQILIEELELAITGDTATKTQLIADIKKMARESIDPMFQLFCIKGYPLGLQAAANGMHVKGKTEGMSGAMAPDMWQGSVEDRQKVLEYVGQDAVIPLQVAQKIEAQGLLSWTSKSGRPQTVRMDSMLTVAECMNIPLPDTSWMSNPRHRGDFYGWAFEQSKSEAEEISLVTGIPVHTVQDVLDTQKQLALGD